MKVLGYIINIQQAYEIKSPSPDFQFLEQQYHKKRFCCLDCCSKFQNKCGLGSVKTSGDHHKGLIHVDNSIRFFVLDWKFFDS